MGKESHARGAAEYASGVERQVLRSSVEVGPDVTAEADIRSRSPADGAQCNVPFCQFFTLVEWVRAMEIMDSMVLVLRSVRARVGDTSRRSTVSVSASASRRRAAAPG